MTRLISCNSTQEHSASLKMPPSTLLLAGFFFHCPSPGIPWAAATFFLLRIPFQGFLRDAGVILSQCGSNPAPFTFNNVRFTSLWRAIVRWIWQLFIWYWGWGKDNGSQRSVVYSGCLWNPSTFHIHTMMQTSHCFALLLKIRSVAFRVIYRVCQIWRN